MLFFEEPRGFEADYPSMTDVRFNQIRAFYLSKSGANSKQTNEMSQELQIAYPADRAIARPNPNQHLLLRFFSPDRRIRARNWPLQPF